MARNLPLPLLLLLLSLFLRSPDLVRGSTNSDDVSALNVMYSSLNSPSSLTGWSSGGGDPCSKKWKGIKCSGSSVTEMFTAWTSKFSLSSALNMSNFLPCKVSGLGLTGSMGYQLASLTSVTYFDLSKNNINGDIPYQLPPNATHINLAGNAFTGGIPYSVSQMTNLKYLNLANNQLNGQLNDMFGNLRSLTQLDLSFNRFSGSLPQSFGSLSHLKTLNLQNNQLSGPLDSVASLSLEDLNIENNQFTGWIPKKLEKIDNLRVGGNSWSSEPAPPGMVKAADNSKGRSSSTDGKGKGLPVAIIAAIVIAALVVVLGLLALIKQRCSSSSYGPPDRQFSQTISNAPLVDNASTGFKDSCSSIDIKALEESTKASDQPPPPSDKGSFRDQESAKISNYTGNTDPISLVNYSFTDLVAATGNFNSSRLLGQGSIGSVYRAKVGDEKVLAVKKLETSLDLSGSGSYNFMEVVTGISKLRHSNISELLGYCSEPGQQLLVYELQGNGSLYGFLHLSDAYSRPLTWETRVRIALGIARAVEYLHVCSPPVIHKNIKSANILLDAELNPHLAECGLAVFFEEASENLGPGSIAPECTKPSDYTAKSDVYSFGVVMLELLTGRKAFDSSSPEDEQLLVRWAVPQLHDIDTLARMVDPALRGLYPPKSLSRFADIISLCIQSEAEFRPAMFEVVQLLVRCAQRPSVRMFGMGYQLNEDSD